MENEIVPITPIEYVYNEENDRQKAILEQVKTFCNTPETQEDKDTWAYIWQVIRRLSVLTCWAEGADDTFILQERTQIYNTAQTEFCKCKCDCREDIITVPLAYEPIPEQAYISGKITILQKGTFIHQDLDVEYLKEHTDWEAGVLYINREDFPNVLEFNSCCGRNCVHKVKIELKYNAGYATIPDGLLPVVCKLIQSVDTDRTDECASAMTLVSGRLTEKKVGNVAYKWATNDTSKYTVNNLISELSALGVYDEVMTYSRCYLSDYSTKAGDVVC